MAIGFDVASESSTGTTGQSGAANFSWSHAGGGSAKGALVFVFGVVTNALPPVTSVTYGGATMTAVPYTAIDTDTEPGSVRAYYLDNCGTGTKTVQVNRSDATPWAHVLYAVCFTVTSSQQISTLTEVYAAGVKTRAGSAAEQTAADSSGTGTATSAGLSSIDDGSPGANSLRFMGRYQGTSNVTAAGSGSTAGPSIDFGLYVIDTFYETTAGQGARNVGGAAISDDLAQIALAVREKPPTGSFTANAVLKRNQTGSLTADAVLKKTASATFTADAVKGMVPVTFTANAVIRKVVTSAFSANAVNRSTITGSVRIGISPPSGGGNNIGQLGNRDAWGQSLIVTRTTTLLMVVFQAGSIGAPTDELILELRADSGGAPSGTVVATLASISGIVSTDVRMASASIGLSVGTYWLVWRRSGSPSATDYYSLVVTNVGVIGVGYELFGSAWSGPQNSNAWYLADLSGATADAVLFANSGTKTFTANAVILRSGGTTFTANAVKFANSGTKTFAADAVIKAPRSSSFTANAVILRSGGTTFTADAVIARNSGTKTFTADAVIARIVWSDNFNRTTPKGYLGVPWWPTVNLSSYPLEDFLPDLHVDGSAGVSTWGGADDSHTSYFFGGPNISRGRIKVDIKTPLFIQTSLSSTIWFTYNTIHYDTKLDIGMRNNGGVAKFWAGSSIDDIYLPGVEADTWYTVEIGFSTIGTSGAPFQQLLRISKRDDPSIFVEHYYTGYGLGITTAALSATPNADRLGGYPYSFDNLTFISDQTSFTVNGGWLAMAFIQATRTGSLTADAVLKKTASATFTADALLLSPRTATFAADAVIAAGSRRSRAH